MSNFQEMNGGDLEDTEFNGMAEEELKGILDGDEESEADRDDRDDGEEDEDFVRERGEDAFPTPPSDIRESIERLDALLAETQGEDKIRAGLGIRLALGMAQELKNGMALGTETADMVSGWLITYGQETVDAAVSIARQFLTKPEDMRKALGQRLGLGNQD